MTPHLPIYMDYGATTPVDPRVVDAMIPWLREHHGNPASRSHAWGWEAEEAVEAAVEAPAAEAPAEEAAAEAPAADEAAAENTEAEKA